MEYIMSCFNIICSLLICGWYRYTKFNRLYVRKNTATLTDSVLQLGIGDTQQQTFYSVSKVNSDFMNVIPTDGTLVRWVFMMDSQEDTYERVVYSLLDMSGNIGGLYGVFIAGGGVIIGLFAQRLFEFSMISRLYQTSEDIS